MISDKGRIKSIGRYVSTTSRWGTSMISWRPERIRKIGSSPNGYCVIALCRHGVMQHYSVHRLVATTFKRNPKNLPEINHKDGNKRNNSVGNLEWTTSSDNQKHAHRLGLQSQKGESHNASKLSEWEVVEIKELLRLNTPQSRIAFEYGVSQGAISRIHQGITWRHVI